MKTKISILGIAILILSINVGCKSENNKNNNKAVVEKESINKVEVVSNKEPTKSIEAAKLKSSFVCYVNNSYMGKEQIPVEVDGKTYYGCCEGCVDKLQNIRDYRFAIDPFTGVEVDKAKAYIVLKPNGNGEVLYFENEDTYLKSI